MLKPVKCLLALPIVVVGIVFQVKAEEAERKMPKLTVVESFGEADAVPGSTSFIDGEELSELKGGADDISRVLRAVPGVNIQEEDGFGLRPNISFRGVPNERSARISLMEDSIPISPAPYSAPSAYYFPPVGRMSGVEVLKGNAQLKYGPYTTGGSLNFLSTPIPQRERVFARSQFGEFGTRIFHVHAGVQREHFGGLIETYQSRSDGFKELDGGGDTGFTIEDFQTKFRARTSADAKIYQELEIKLGTYEQDSDETYVGLTQADFDADPFRRYAGTQLDRIRVDHDQIFLTHFAQVTDKVSVTTRYYYHDTARNWFKLEKVGGESVSSILDRPEEFAEQLSWIEGADSPEDAFALRNNRRDYFARGVSSSVTYEESFAGVNNALELGFRYHEDEEDRFQEEENFQMIDGRLVQTSVNDPGSNANRIGSAEAWAFHLQNVMEYEQFVFVPSLRYELIQYTRRDFGKEDPERLGGDLATTRNSIDQLIPGFGMRFEGFESVQPFLGVHRGFSPPGPASTDQVEEEDSINYEIGTDFNVSDLSGRVLFFLTDYDNLLGADTVSGGGEGTGDLFNGGEATAYGFESELDFNLANFWNADSYAMPVDLTYTFTNAEFDSTFDSDFFGEVTDGDDIPYIAENQIHARLGFDYGAFNAALRYTFVDSMATVTGSATGEGALDTDSYSVFDLDVGYKVNSGVRLFLGLKNLFDEEYVVARRPAGARPGLPQLFFGGIEVDLGA